MESKGTPPRPRGSTAATAVAARPGGDLGRTVFREVFKDYPATPGTQGERFDVGLAPSPGGGGGVGALRPSSSLAPASLATGARTSSPGGSLVATAGGASAVRAAVEVAASQSRAAMATADAAARDAREALRRLGVASSGTAVEDPVIALERRVASLEATLADAAAAVADLRRPGGRFHGSAARRAALRGLARGSMLALCLQAVLALLLGRPVPPPGWVEAARDGVAIGSRLVASAVADAWAAAVREARADAEAGRRLLSGLGLAAAAAPGRAAAGWSALLAACTTPPPPPPPVVAPGTFDFLRGGFASLLPSGVAMRGLGLVAAVLAIVALAPVLALRGPEMTSGVGPVSPSPRKRGGGRR